MLRIIYLLCFAAIIVGCSMEEKKLEQSSLEASPEPTSIVTSIPNTEETNSPTTSTNYPEPQYIDETKYEGDELGVVKTLNNLVRAVYEKDFNTYNSLITGDMNPSTGLFKKYYISIDTLDFNVNPEPAPPDGAIPVVLEYTELHYEDNEPVKDKQIFVFQFEDQIWKLLYVADWWIF